jgi:hypothetical protein
MLALACGLLLLEVLQIGRASPRWQSSCAAAFLLGLGSGLGTLVKPTFLPFTASAAVVIAWDGVRRQRLLNLPAFAAGAAIVIPNFVFNWYYRGSPFYPFRVVEWLPYNHQWAQILGQLRPDLEPYRVPYALIALVWNVRPGEPFLNIGFAGVLLLLLGAAGAVHWWRRGDARPYLICVSVSALVTLTQLGSSSNASMLTAWASVLGRFIVPNLAPILLLAARYEGALRLVVIPVFTAEYFLHAPLQWPRQVVLSTAIVLASVLTAVVAPIIAARWRSTLKWPAIAVAVVACLMVIQAVQDRSRYPSYYLFTSGQLDDFHSAQYAEAWPMWLRLEESAPARVATAAGWDGVGHNWFRSGLLGSRLQHDVRYVPVTADGSIVDYADPAKLMAVADREAWLARLVDQRIEWVALLPPRTLEHEWVNELPDVFSTELKTEAGGILARVNQQNLSRRLRPAAQASRDAN